MKISNATVTSKQNFIEKITLKITLKTKTLEKSISCDFIEFRILRYVLHCSNFFGARLQKPKFNKRGGGVLITVGGSDFFFKINKRGGGAYSGPQNKDILTGHFKLILRLV